MQYITDDWLTKAYVSKATLAVDVCHSGLSGIGCLSGLKYRFPTCLPAGRRASLAGMTKNEALLVMFLVTVDDQLRVYSGGAIYLTPLISVPGPSL